MIYEREPQSHRRRGRRLLGALSGLAMLAGAGTACGSDDGTDCMDYVVYAQGVAEPFGAALRDGPSLDADLVEPDALAANTRMKAAEWAHTGEKAYAENPDGSPSEGEVWYRITGYYKMEDGTSIFIEFNEQVVYATSAALRSRMTYPADAQETDEQFADTPAVCERSEEELASLAAA